MHKNGHDAASVVRDTIYRATMALDDQKWEDWLDLCDEEFHYRISAFSPEINKDMIYLQGKRKDMETLVRLLPKHNTDHSPLRRHTSVYTVDVADASYLNTIGDAELRAVWTDPDFNSEHRAFYYARVLEIPTPTWQAYDAKFYSVEMPDTIQMKGQERAYTSPIWYTP